jgi:hypothetical protein
MIIILRRISENTEKDEIIDFLTPILKGSLLKRTGHIENIKILTLKDTLNDTIEYHGLVTIDSDAAANRAIKKLNRKVFKNRNVIVREYFHRSWHNDPRVNMHEWNEELENKRKNNRRRSRLEVISEESMRLNRNEKDHPTF